MFLYVQVPGSLLNPTRLIFSPTLDDLGDRDKKEMVAIIKLYGLLVRILFFFFLFMFGCKIQRILTLVSKYGDYQITRKVSKEYIYQL